MRENITKLERSVNAGIDENREYIGRIDVYKRQEYENKFNDNENCNDIYSQMEHVRELMYSEKDHLYYHAYDEKKVMIWADKETGLSPNFWSRALGWYLMALADCYELMPKEQEEYRKELAAQWKEAVDGMLGHQDKESGLFYQLTAQMCIRDRYTPLACRNDA